MLLNNVSTNLNNQLINSYLYQKTNPYLPNINSSFSNSSSFKPAYILDLSNINQDDSLDGQGLVYTKEEVLERSKSVDLNKIKELLPEESKQTLDDIINNLAKSEDKELTERLLKVLGNDVIPSLEENDLNQFMENLSQVTGLLSKENPELLDDFVTTLEAVEGKNKDKFLKVTKSLLEMVYEETDRPKSKKLLTVEDLKGLMGEGADPISMYRKEKDPSSPIQKVFFGGAAGELFPDDEYSFDLTTIPTELSGLIGYEKLDEETTYNLMDEDKIYIEAPEGIYEVSLGEDKEIAVNIVDEGEKESLGKSENYYQMEADESCFFKVGENEYVKMTVGKKGYAIEKREDSPKMSKSEVEKLYSKATLTSPSEEELIEGFFNVTRQLSNVDQTIQYGDYWGRKTDFTSLFIETTGDLLDMLDKRYDGFEKQFGEVKNTGKLITIMDFFKDFSGDEDLPGTSPPLLKDILPEYKKLHKSDCFFVDCWQDRRDTLSFMVSSEEYHRRSSREKLLYMGDEFMGEEIKNSLITYFS